MALTDEALIDTPGMLSRYVRLASGARAHYATAGENGPPIVLLHGGINGSSGLAGWRYMAPVLAENGFRVFCPDMPGFGLSDTNPEHAPTGMESYVDFIHEFVTALCLDRFHLGGNSMGCGNAVNYTCAHPDRVVSLALIAGPVGDVAPPMRLDNAPALFAFDGSEESMRAMLERIVYRTDALSDELITMRTQAALRNQAAYAAIPKSVFAYVTCTTEDPNVAARLRTKGRLDQLTIPAIYLFGRQDALLPVEHAYQLEDHLPNIQFFYPDECGHQGQTDQPEMFNQVFVEFFRDGRVSRKTAEWAGVSDRRPELAVVEPVDGDRR